ncbi:MAG: glycine betaine ABC transporter substrate-binding protein [Peptococcales bacterium]|jgi:glycine betaine/proline transport system substrate-binding protein
MNKKVLTLLITFLTLSLVITGCSRTEKEAKGVIIGIDPGAGIMSSAEKALEEYDLDNFEIIEGSDATMISALNDAIRNEKWIVVTGWTPHFKFAKWDLKYLDDPKKAFGDAEQINTIVRKGLKEDLPDVYTFLDNFNWTLDDMQTLEVWNEEPGADPYENAKRWIGENEAKVNQWIEGLELNSGNGQKVELVYVEWASEIASTNVVRAVLQEKLGYNVEIISVGAAAMWQGVATGDVDGMVAAWLPVTHGSYLEEVKDKVENLGPNINGARIGLVVPDYVTIDSIEDLKENADKFQK